MTACDRRGRSALYPAGVLMALAGWLVCGAGTAPAQDPGFPFRGDAETTALSESRACVYAPGTPRPTEQPIRLGPGPHLFVDDYLIARSDGVERVVTGPQRDASISNPVITGKEDGCFQPYMTVLRDGETGRFRIWYGSRTVGANTTESHVAVMDSDDGVHWQRPARVLQDPAPIQFGSSVVDRGGAFRPETQRYALGWWKDGGLKVAVSPDGEDFTPLSSDVLLRHNHDINSLFFDPIRQRYVATISVYRPGAAWSGERRITMQSYSPDLTQWSAPHYVVTPEDGADAGETQFYAMDGYLVRGGLILGMVKVLRDDLKADDPPDPPEAYGMGYTALAWSRDGETWYRDRAHYFDPDPVKGAWDHAHAWIDEQVPVNGEVYLYYGGYARGHKVNRFEERQIGVVKIRQDRYVARRAGATPGRLVTPVVILEGAGITVNTNAAGGSVRARVLDSSGRELPGFGLEDAATISEDSLNAPLRWSRPLASLAGQAVRLEFELQNAAIYALEVTTAP